MSGPFSAGNDFRLWCSFEGSMRKDKTKAFNFLFLVPRIRRFTLAYVESLFTDLYMYRPIVRSYLGWERESVHSRLVFAGDETWSH